MNKKTIVIFLSFFSPLLYAQNYPSGNSLLDKIDTNMSSETTVMTASMQVNSARATRTMTLKTWMEGDKKAFTEYLSPAREKGTKMLKLDNQLWLYSPSTDRTIPISGHMLRQSVMGSDLSYEDMMNDTPMQEQYNAVVTGEETINGRKCWVVDMTARISDINYYSRKLWVDQERFVPIKMQLFAKSGKQLKEIALSDIRQIQGRWYPMKTVYKDVLKDGKGTEFTISEISFNQRIPGNVFNKSNLK